MNHAVFKKLRRLIVRRHVANVLIWALPLLAAVLLLRQLASPRIAFAGAFLALVLLVYRVIRAMRSVDFAMLVRKLDASSPKLEDSADLLLDEAVQRTPLQDLQRERVRARIQSVVLADLRPSWSWRLPLLLGGILMALIVLAAFLPEPATTPAISTNGLTHTESAVESTRIRSSQMDIAAPLYTGLAARSESTLDATVAEGSRLHWQPEFDPQPESVKLSFHDGSEIALQRDKSTWSGEKVLTESALYRIVIESTITLDDDRLYRLDVIVDQAPVIKVVEPDKTLSLFKQGQRSWPLEFEVTDDYGVAEARLAITLAQGTGEQVTVSERSERLHAQAGDGARRHRYRRKLDLASLGYSEGDDLIVRLIAHDTREPSANMARSPSYILRWPPQMASESEGVEGIVQKVLPAYFRSQRQIIIDSEALIEDRSTLDADRFLARSDTIGVDQKILRLRYGQFLGEEFESGATVPHGNEDHDEEGEATQQDALTDDHTHQQASESSSQFGNEANVLAEYGHTHDHAGAATLLDPETKKILKSALAEMWQAELHLRQGEPGKALPYENRALNFIKQVQQSTRIYLSRVGLELPPVDLTRRLSGERKGVQNAPGVLVDSIRDDKVIDNTYQSLSKNSSVDLEAFDTWLRGPGAKRVEALSLIEAVDSLRRQPDCADCRKRLLEQLWQAMPAPPVVTKLRNTPNEAGRDYLDRLDTGVQP